MKLRGSDQPAPGGGKPVVLSQWYLRDGASKCMCCGGLVPTVIPIDDEQCLRLLEHQLNCEGIPRDLANEVTNAARAHGLPTWGAAPWLDE